MTAGKKEQRSGGGKTVPYPQYPLCLRDGERDVGCTGVIKKITGIYIFSKKLLLQGCRDVWNMGRSHSHMHITGGTSDPMPLGTGFRRPSEFLSIACVHARTHTQYTQTHKPWVSYIKSWVARPRHWMSREQERPPAKKSSFLLCTQSSTHPMSCLCLAAVWTAAVGGVLF